MRNAKSKSNDEIKVAIEAERGYWVDMYKALAILLLVFVVLSRAYCADFTSKLDEARALARSGNLSRAKSICTEIISAAPGAPIEPSARLLMGDILAKDGSSPKVAIDQLLQLISRFTDSPEVPEALLHIGYLRDRIRETPNEWQQIIDRFPDTKESAEALYRLGFQALRAGDPVLAAERFKKPLLFPEPIHNALKIAL